MFFFWNKPFQLAGNMKLANLIYANAWWGGGAMHLPEWPPVEFCSCQRRKLMMTYLKPLREQVIVAVLELVDTFCIDSALSSSDLSLAVRKSSSSSADVICF